MFKCGLCCHLVSVCPSVMLVYCIHKAEDNIKLLSWPSSPILVFDPKRRYPIPRGTPSEEAQNTRGEKILRFSLKSPFISKWYKIGPWLLWDVNRKSLMVSMTC